MRCPGLHLPGKKNGGRPAPECQSQKNRFNRHGRTASTNQNNPNDGDPHRGRCGPPRSRSDLRCHNHQHRPRRHPSAGHCRRTRRSDSGTPQTTDQPTHRPERALRSVGRLPESRPDSHGRVHDRHRWASRNRHLEHRAGPNTANPGTASPHSSPLPAQPSQPPACTSTSPTPSSMANPSNSAAHGSISAGSHWPFRRLDK
jgi:hypothetical protein